MLPRSQRLHRSKDIQFAMRKGKRVPTKAGVFFFLPSTSQSRGCAITPKKIGNSVIRHRTARRVREALRNFFFTHPTSFDIVVLTHSKDLSVSEWEEALRKASV
jgi:ribonuclease P protein component